MATFELLPQPEEQAGLQPSKREGLGGTLLLSNSLWFMRLRWIVVAVFVAAALAFDLLPGPLRRLGLTSPARSLWVLAGILAAANCLLILTVPRSGSRARVELLKAHLWAQIIADLLVLTLLVHAIGSTDTFVAFAYLFHIALSCIFFPARESFLVTVVASFLYLTAVVLEATLVWPRAGVLAGVTPGPSAGALRFLFALSAIFTWFVVWYLVSTLSNAVRLRDQQLERANARLQEADRTKNQQVIVTTHELKAPFSGIASNIEVLKVRFWQDISPAAREIVDRIELRARTLSERISAILLLGELRTRRAEAPTLETVNLKALADAAMDEVAEKAAAANIAVDSRVPPIEVPGNARHFSVLLANLLANAITYSHPGGRVAVSAGRDGERVWLRVSDHGIGIREDALPHVFEEYYRSSEASRYNRLSTGLGLSIVKEIARAYSLTVRVESEQGAGSTFEVVIPGNQDESRRNKHGQGRNH
jgi:two-component system phosphate regulon sensor histidine kinase PhoR